jgi:hypothetical protein
MRKIGIGLSALLILAAAAKQGTAQDASAVASPQYPGCVSYEVVEFPGCVNVGTLSEDQARTARGHPQFVESQVATASQTLAPRDEVEHKDTSRRTDIIRELFGLSLEDGIAVASLPAAVRARLLLDGKNLPVD